MRNIFFLLLICIFLSACTKMPEHYLYVVEYSEPIHHVQKDKPDVLKKLLNVSVDKEKDDKSKLAYLRVKAIKDAGHLIALQSAIHWAYNHFLTETKKHANALDKIFNFAPLMLKQGQTTIMPPVIAETRKSLRIDDEQTATTAQVTYELLSPARFISVIPSWQIYLLLEDFPKPAELNPALYPRNKQELKIWKKAIEQGWTEGIEQASELYKTNVSRLARDYKGVVLYHLLTAQYLLSRTRSAQAHLGLYIEGKKMHVSQKVYRITSPSRFINDYPKKEKSIFFKVDKKKIITNKEKTSLNKKKFNDKKLDKKKFNPNNKKKN